MSNIFTLHQHLRFLSGLLLTFSMACSGSVALAFEPEEEATLRNRVAYHLVDRHLRVTTYDTFSPHKGQAKRRQDFDDAILNDEPADKRFVIFDEVELIDILNESSKFKLLEAFQANKLVIGARGYGKQLKMALGLLPADLATAATTTGGHAAWVLLKYMPGGYLSELEIPAPGSAHSKKMGSPRSKKKGLANAFDLIHDWDSRNEALSPSAPALGDDAPWNAVHIYEYSDYTQAVYKGTLETAGTYKVTMSVFWLASSQNSSDWYRIDYQVISEITNYEMTGDKFGDTHGTCGWWSDYLYAGVTIQTLGGEWFQYMPDTTVGSTSTGFSIGGDLTTDSGGVSAAYSQSYGEPDVTIAVAANSVDNTIGWKATPQGCHNYSWYPDYSGASSPARTTYNLNPSLIIQVPEGSPMQAVSANNTVGTPTEIVVRKDYIKLCGTFDTEVCSTHYTGGPAIIQSMTCTESGCS